MLICHMFAPSLRRFKEEEDLVFILQVTLGEMILHGVAISFFYLLCYEFY